MRCLNDETLPLALRVIGALIRLYGVSLAAVVELTVDRFTREDTRAYLRIDRHPVLLPPKLADLIDRLIAEAGAASMLKHSATRSRYLFLGNPPSRGLHCPAAGRAMALHGLSVIHARNTVMLAAVAELPPIVISDLFGVHPQTAHRWPQFAQQSWSEYLRLPTRATTTDVTTSRHTRLTLAMR
ncbi:hypothetical protein ACW9HO_38070 [Nocardia gipuzkoensis]